MKKIIILILSSVVMIFPAIGDWTTYCSISQGNDIISTNGKIYVATDGGLIEHIGSESNIYDTDNGLFKINTTAVEADFRNIVWAGHSDCSISLFDKNGNSVGSLSDIEEYGSYSLNRIYSSDNYVYIATDQILVRYSYNSTFDKYDVTDSNLMTGNVSDVIVHNGNIYISTTSGIYMISESSQNIGYLENWTLLIGFDPSTIVNKFLIEGERTLALTSNGIYSINGSNATKETLEDGNSILWGQVYNNEFFYTKVSGDIILSKVDLAFMNMAIEVYRTNDQIAQRFVIEDDTIHYISNSGFSSYSISNTTTTSHPFNLPAEKGIKKIKVSRDNSKLLYLNSQGFREFDIFSESFNDEYFTGTKLWQGINLIEDNNENIYVTTWSTGVFKFNKDYDLEERYTFGSAILPPSPYYPYATHPGVSKDRSGNIWITNYGDVDQDSTIVKIGVDGSITPYILPTYQSPYNIFVDDNDWVWLGSSSQQFNERDGLGVGKVDGNTLNIKAFTGLGGIIDINKDSKNFVWIGTNNGIKYIDMNYANADEPGDLTSGDIESMIEGPVGNMIYDIEISDVNEKWFATNKGVSVLSSDNTAWRHYVPASYKDDGRLEGDIIYSALPDDAITDIELSPENGKVIFSSYNGISMMEIINTGNIPDDEIYTTPSPFLNDGINKVSFSYKGDYNTAKIFNLQGKLVKGGDGSKMLEISNNLPAWDGRDNDGNIVSSGIYQVVIFNSNDPSVKMVGKIAVVRR